MAIEIATAINGQISEDDKESWLSVEEFKNRHEDILSMSYEQANEMSLEEIPFMDDVRDPIWEEDDRRNEEYIKIHGEVELTLSTGLKVPVWYVTTVRPEGFSTVQVIVFDRLAAGRLAPPWR